MGEDVEKRVVIGLAKDGSGVGGENQSLLYLCAKLLRNYVLAALCASMALKHSS